MGFTETHSAAARTRAPQTLWEQHVPSHTHHLLTPKHLHLNIRQGGCEAPKWRGGGGEFGEEELKAARVERGGLVGNVKMSLQSLPGRYQTVITEQGVCNYRPSTWPNLRLAK